MSRSAFLAMSALRELGFDPQKPEGSASKGRAG